MNKKFSTLMAAALLAGTFAYAEGGPVKVNPKQLVDGEYILANAKGDSIVTFAGQGTWDNVLVKESAVDAATESEYVKLEKSGTSYTISHNGKVIYVHSDNVAYTGEGSQLVTITGNADSTLYVRTNTGGSVDGGTPAARKYLVRDGAKVVGLARNTYAGAKFVLYSLPAEAPAGTTLAAIDEIKQTFRLIIDDKYVGAASTVAQNTRVSGTTDIELVAVEEGLTDETNFVWMEEAGAYKNLATGKYLTVTAAGKVGLSEDPVVISYNGNALIANNLVAGAAVVVESETFIPYQGTSFSAVTAKDGATCVIYVDGDKALMQSAAGAPVTSETYSSQENDFNYMWTMEARKVGEKAGEAVYDYYFKNKATGEYLQINGKNVFVDDVTDFTSQNQLKVSDTEYVSFDLTITKVKGQVATFGFAQAGSVWITAQELRAIYGDSFEMSFTTTDDKAIEGDDAFAGVLKPVNVYYNNKAISVYPNPRGTSFALANEDGKIIVMDKTDKYANVSANDYGYKFKLFTPEELRRALIDDPDGYGWNFNLRFAAGQLVADVNEAEFVYCEGQELGLLTVNGKKYLSVGNEHYELDDVKIKLTNINLVDPAELLKEATFFNVSYLNSKKYATNWADYNTILGLDDNGKAAFVDKDKTQQDKPEGQWAIQINEDYADKDANGQVIGVTSYKFVNRENGASFLSLNVKNLYKTDKENVYAYVHPWISGNAVSDTISIVPVKTDEADGFARWTKAVNTLYNVGVYSSVREDAIWTSENHADNHVIGLEKDIEDATAWRFKLNTYKYIDKYGDEFIKVDTVYVPTDLSYWDAAKKAWATKTDTLKILSYALVNSANSESVAYDNEEKAYACNDGNQRFVFKEVGDHYNLIQLNDSEWDKDTNHDRHILNGSLKVYGGDSANKGLLDYTSDVYDKIENDLFTVEETEAPMYRTITPMDTISIFRQENDKQMLFEDGKFLGLKNATQFDINSAMFVDTAYVRYDTYRPLYMLALNPEITPAGMWCEEHQSSTCEHAVPTKGWVEARYLVNLKDSAIACEDLHTNEFVNSEKYYKLGFVQATHKNDTLTIASTNDSIFVGDADLNVAKFAFRIVDNETKAFVIETANYYTLDAGNYWAGKLNENYPDGYLKWMNGVVVVVDKIEDADIFNMTEGFEGDPTANETIAAGNVVVAGVNGAVVVKGAEGKNVIVSTILGKVVANEVVSSDNATIAAPAGIVVVSVDGESFKVVVK